MWGAEPRAPERFAGGQAGLTGPAKGGRNAPSTAPAQLELGEPAKLLARPQSGPGGVANGQWERPQARRGLALEPQA